MMSHADEPCNKCPVDFVRHYINFVKNKNKWEARVNPHYKNLICLKEVKNRSKKSENSVKNLLRVDPTALIPEANVPNFLCVRPRGHPGRCGKHFVKLDGKIRSKLGDNFVYSTPGNDGKVCPNRSSRLHLLHCSKEEQRQLKTLKVFNQKGGFVIPQSEGSTPLLMACLYWDLMWQVSRIENVSMGLSECTKNKLDKHGDHFLQTLPLGCDILDKKGYLQCPINQTAFILDNLVNVDKDDPQDMDIQAGHLTPRCNDDITLRPENVLLMSRYGNIMMGNKNFQQATDEICRLASKWKGVSTENMELKARVAELEAKLTSQI